jgi:predicted RNase H-like HicB family nuclease
MKSDKMTSATERKPLEYYLNLKYPFTIEESSEGGYFVQIKDLPGCSAQGETLTEACEMIDVARKMWLEVAFEHNQDIPLPRTEREYSGKFNVRFPKSLHRQLHQMANREGISLNQFLVSTLSKTVGLENVRGKRKSSSKNN